MRTTMHSGRTSNKGTYKPNHNDRNFDMNKADHIDQERTKNNLYWNLMDGTYSEQDKSKRDIIGHDKAELRYYEEQFGHQLQRTNDKYMANGHKERVKTMEQWKACRQYAPEEVIYQIGDRTNQDEISSKLLASINRDYKEWIDNWNDSHNNPFTRLSMSFHADESSLHLHERRVWHYQGQEGRLYIGQEKALEQAGVALPEPDKAIGKHNNRKITFDKMCRNKWIEICKSYNLDIEEVPLPRKRSGSRDLEQYIEDKYADRLQEAQQINKAINNASRQLEGLQEAVESLTDQYSDQPAFIQHIEQLNRERELNDQISKLKKHNKQLEAFAKQYAAEFSRYQMAHNKPNHSYNKDLLM